MRTKMKYALIALLVLSLLIVGCTTTDDAPTSDEDAPADADAINTSTVDTVEENLDTQDVDAAFSDINLDDW